MLQFVFTRNLGQSLHVITSLDLNFTLFISWNVQAIMEPSRGFIVGGDFDLRFLRFLPVVMHLAFVRFWNFAFLLFFATW